MSDTAYFKQFLLLNKTLKMKKTKQKLNWPSLQEQKDYWIQQDNDLDRTESCCQWFDERPTLPSILQSEEDKRRKQLNERHPFA